MAEENVNSTLFVSRPADNEQITLTTALESFVEAFAGKVPDTWALLYAPTTCFFAALKNRALLTEEAEIDLEKAAVYEARIFNDTGELRWLNREDGKGTAVVLCGDPSLVFFGATAKEKQLRGTIRQTYLLWGESAGASDGNGWTKFAEARVGSFFVPVDGVAEGKKRRARFTALEYLGEHADGNVAVVDERLTGIELA